VGCGQKFIQHLQAMKFHIFIFFIIILHILKVYRISKMQKNMILKVFIIADRKDILCNKDANFIVISISSGMMTIMSEEEIFKAVKEQVSDEKITLNKNHNSVVVSFRDILKYVKSPEDISDFNIEKGLDEALCKMDLSRSHETPASGSDLRN